MEINFTGKTALVTGASRGIGRDIAIQLAKCGAKIIAVARNKTLLETLKEEIPSAELISVDLADWKATQKALSPFVSSVDLLVNNAGLAIIKPLPSYSEEDFDDLFNINIKSLVNVTQLVSEQLLKRKAPGAIVNISSQTSKVGLLNHSVYAATKGAVDAFTRTAALELGPHKIRVNSVNPTVILTEMTLVGFPTQEMRDAYSEKLPLRKLGEVREVSDAVLYLLSDKASMITGVSLLVDGGYVAM